MNGHKLSIHPIFRSLSWMRKFGYKKPIQNSLAKIGIKIKNIDKKPFKGGKIKNIIMHESSVPHECALALISDKEFEIPNLNPEETKKIWFETYLFRFSGLVWLRFEINGEDKIISHQWDKANKSHEEFGENNWSDIFMVVNEHVLQQRITNSLVIILTILILIFSIS